MTPPKAVPAEGTAGEARERYRGGATTRTTLTTTLDADLQDSFTNVVQADQPVTAAEAAQVHDMMRAVVPTAAPCS